MRKTTVMRVPHPLVPIFRTMIERFREEVKKTEAENAQQVAQQINESHLLKEVA